MYEDLSITLFVSAYLAIVEMVKRSFKSIIARHLKELIADAGVYGWALVRAYHAIWLQQIENGRVQWMNAEPTVEVRGALVWRASHQTT